jgi:PKD repeat protein
MGMKQTLLSLVIAGGLFGASFVHASTPLPPTYYCPQITVQLSLGSSDRWTNGQVTALQQFLAARYGNQLVTGYFGAMTRANVVRFQVEQGLSPVGIVGPYTRAALANCGGTTPPPANASFEASPANGSAPLAVTFKINSLPSGVDTSSVYVDFGDSETAPLQSIYCFAAPCNPVATASHTYKTAGTYTAKLMQNNNYCTPGMYCTLMYREPTVLAYATVVVSGSATAAPSINSVSGPTQLALGQTGSWTVQATGVSSNATYSVVWGDEANAGFYLGGAPAMQSSSAGFTHTYQRAGTYYPRFTVTNANGLSSTANLTVVVQ